MSPHAEKINLVASPGFLIWRLQVLIGKAILDELWLPKIVGRSLGSPSPRDLGIHRLQHSPIVEDLALHHGGLDGDVHDVLGLEGYLRLFDILRYDLTVRDNVVVLVWKVVFTGSSTAVNQLCTAQSWAEAIKRALGLPHLRGLAGDGVLHVHEAPGPPQRGLK